jgi:hypothetical protein
MYLLGSVAYYQSLLKENSVSPLVSLVFFYFNRLTPYHSTCCVLCGRPRDSGPWAEAGRVPTPQLFVGCHILQAEGLIADCGLPRWLSCIPTHVRT